MNKLGPIFGWSNLAGYRSKLPNDMFRSVEWCSSRLLGSNSFSTSPEKPIDLYYLRASPPNRAVLMTAKVIGVNVNVIHVNFREKEHLTPQFLKMSPQHKTPTIDDNGFFLTESRAITAYLCNKYAKDDSLYPKDPQKRAKVDQRLYFDMGTLYQSFMDYFLHCIMGQAPHNEELFMKIHECLKIFNGMLEESNFATGESFTLADISLLATVTAMEAVGINVSQYRNIDSWLSKCKELIPDYKKLNQDGLLDLKTYWDIRFAKNQLRRSKL